MSIDVAKEHLVAASARSWGGWLGHCALYLAIYTILDFVSYLKPYGNLGVTAWNPQMGLSLALIYLGGARYIAPVLLAQIFSDYILRSAPLGFAVEIVTSGVSGGIAIGAAMMMRTLLPVARELNSLRDALRFVIVSTLASLCGAIAYTGVLWISATLGRGEFFPVSWRAFVGNLIGILSVAPALLVFSDTRNLQWPGRQAAWQAITIIASLVLIFGYREATAFQLFYLLFLPLLWVALTYGIAGIAIALPVIQIGLVIGAQIRFGTDPGLTALQVLMIALAITGLLAGAIYIEREVASARIREQQNALNRALRIRAAGEIATGIAHEINQPLSAIKSYAAVADEAVAQGNDGLAREAIAKMSAQTARAASIIKSIRELLYQGAVDRARTDLANVLSEVETLSQTDLATRGMHVDVTIPDDFPSVFVDSLQIVQALHNMTNNAADAMQSIGETGAIHIDIRRQTTDMFAIVVSDRGPGFPPGYDVTDPPPFVTTKSDGTGIGLSIVRTIAEAHGGHLLIRSTARGSSVELHLPFGETDDDDQSVGS